ncbi:hypothetical protein PHPALM_31208 [Phytophthora palmivora]|uniref:Uncharacterized protein n=1 Tax=Phytophthora palmivora TaxID=4796 RepID=A0A2P4X381_9STRA|nr:hypothetical protein PHPALM_31208 [Phytophthora palmivora]
MNTLTLRLSPDVVDVTGGEGPWTATSAGRTSDPPSLRTIKRTSGKAVAGARASENISSRAAILGKNYLNSRRTTGISGASD